MKFDDLDRAMRRFELARDRHLPTDQFAVARLDGRGFTRLTKATRAFERPFDQRFHDAMMATCRHLMNAGFRVALCYTQSDEISLLLDKSDGVFHRKERKFVSLLAGEASGVFSLAIGYPAAFDCRISLLQAAENAVDYFRWRSEDARRNAVSAYCYWTLRAEGASPSNADHLLTGLSVAQKLAMLHERRIDFEGQPDWQRLGALLRWESHHRPGRNPITGDSVSALRRRIEAAAPPENGEDFVAIIAEAIAQMQGAGAS